MKTMRRWIFREKSGVALVVVLAFLVLLSLMVLGFLTSVSTELSNSKAVAYSAGVHQLSESAVNLVMAQLVDATKGTSTGALTL